jgi:IPTL-CTERM motif
VTPVPTLQHTALVVLSLLAAAIGWMGLGRRQRVGAGR